MNGVEYVTTATTTPRWLQSLLNDDVHTGRNVGAKLAYMCDNLMMGKSANEGDVRDAKAQLATPKLTDSDSSQSGVINCALRGQ